MLYDKRWDAKIEPLTLAGLIAWLQMQPPSASYDWGNCGGFCLIDLYGKATRVGRISSNRSALEAIFGPRRISDDWGYHSICGPRPWTFGAALARARRLQSHT